MKQTKKTITVRRHRRVRSKVIGSAARPRISVFKSTRYTYLQAIDDMTGRTIAYASTRNNKKPVKEKGEKSTQEKGAKAEFQTARMAAAFNAGKVLAAALKAADITKGVFDRGSYRYAAIVKSAAEGVRAGGVAL